MMRRAVLWISVTLAMAGCWPLVTRRARGPATVVRVIFTGELRGELEPCGCSEGMLGGIDRRDTEARRMMAERPNCIIVDTGDLTVGMGRQVELKAETALLAMDDLGYAAVCAGEGDLQMGFDSLRSVSEVADLPLVCANLERDGKPVFPSHVIRELRQEGGAVVRAAVVGVLSPEFADEIKLIDPRLGIRPPADVLAPLVKRLAAQADLLILLAHMTAAEADYLAAMFPEFSLTICGHGETEPAVRPKRTRGGWLCTTGAKGHHVSYVDLSVEGKRVELIQHDVRLMGPSVPSARAAVDLIDDYLRSVGQEELLARALSGELPPGGIAYVGSAKCQLCHAHAYAVWKKSAHSHALETLEREGRGHHLDPECVPCHVVGFPYMTGFRSRSQTPRLANVGCENCHGPGKKHLADITAPYGKTGEAECRECHTPDRSTEFDYKTYFPKIEHNEKEDAP